MQYLSFPKTRYLGSKRKLLPVLFDVFSSLEFETALDPFSGTGAAAYLLKSMGKKVTAGDGLLFNAAAARALVENDHVRLNEEIFSLLKKADLLFLQKGFVETTFKDRFFFDEENRFIDRFLSVMTSLKGYARDLALFALGQACLAKRPYNLFHRANLNMRSRDVARSFGNKTTWDKPFSDHICAFSAEADRAVFSGASQCSAMCADVFDIPPDGYDVVYLDPPYVSGRGMGVDYADYYHFLDGLAEPDTWPEKILFRYKHRPIIGRKKSPFCDAARISDAFERLIKRFSESSLVISYRSDGIPGVEDIAGFLKKAGKQVRVTDVGKYTYALSRNRASKEIILTGR